MIFFLICDYDVSKLYFAYLTYTVWCVLLTDTFESSLVDTFSEAKDYLAMWTAYIDYYRRRMASDDEEESGSGAGREELMGVFTRARNKLKTGI